MATVFHPQSDDHGNLIIINNPSTPTSLEEWLQPDAVATVLPGGHVPAAINGITFENWTNAPLSQAAWAKVGGQGHFDEPPFVPVPGIKVAAGVVILEKDGRVWVVSPTNQFGGYAFTFPNGTRDPGASLRQTAIHKALEECGLQVELTGFLLDSVRNTSVCRYYTARRVSGSPASMSSKTQAVSLVPRGKLPIFLTHRNDMSLLMALTHEE